jgi:hypothetical protein
LKKQNGLIEEFPTYFGKFSEKIIISKFDALAHILDDLIGALLADMPLN